MSDIIPISNVAATMTWNGITFAVVEITPAIAKKMLENNIKNRPMYQMTMEAYKADKELGNWVFTGDPIRFHQNGTLIDGQHRCTSISLMDDGYSESVLCIFGLDDDAQFAMDQGKKRSTSDQLGLDDYVNTSITAAAVKWVLVMEAGLLFRDNNKRAQVSTSAQIKNWADTHPKEIRIINEVSTDARLCHVSPSMVVLAALLFSKIDEAAAKSFVSQLRTGAGLEEGSAILAFRERALRNRMEKKKDTDRDVLGLLIRAWNAERRGKKITRLQLPKASAGGRPTFSESNFPEPI